MTKEDVKNTILRTYDLGSDVSLLSYIKLSHIDSALKLFRSIIKIVCNCLYFHNLQIDHFIIDLKGLMVLFI